jgi:predicted anti-sigma-YlaC factor YlaD
MSCRDTIHLICWYLEGRLSPAVESEIENHLLGCDDCRMVQEAATTTLDREFDLSRPSGRLPHLRNVTQAA